ncbi:response regulator [Halorientalis litorea]|uniref:response regulator n=1 Tax=Halorientalis litorea TaxID=2931977 RepID=UPI001FF44440|nr:response regulator [Halorientalis litorea]
MGEITILIVDDEQAVADIYGAHLEVEYDVRIAYGGEEALEKLDEDVDIAFLDRRMPGMSGDEVLEQIRAEGLDVRVAMVTAVDPDFDILDMGFDDYLVKPISRDDLYETVDKLLSYAEYDETFEEYYRLVSKRAALQSAKSKSTLEASDEYQELTDRIEELEGALDEAMFDLEGGDMDALFSSGSDSDSPGQQQP